MRFLGYPRQRRKEALMDEMQKRIERDGRMFHRGERRERETRMDRFLSVLAGRQESGYQD